MGFSVNVGEEGTVVRIKGYISRATMRPARMLYGVTINKHPAANHLWFDKERDVPKLMAYKPTPDAAPVLMTVGMEVEVVGEVYVYWDSELGCKATNLTYIEVTVTGRKADYETMVKLCDNQHFPGEVKGTVYLTHPNGEVETIGVGEEARKVRNAKLNAIYFM